MGILQEKGADIYRMKGVLAIADSNKKFVYQAVHMIFNGNFEEEWMPGEPRQSKLVFDDKARAAMIQKLRFAVGTKVECKTGNGWEKGEVIKLLYKESGMQSVAPYQVRLDQGALIFVPVDDDRLCRKVA